MKKKKNKKKSKKKIIIGAAVILVAAGGIRVVGQKNAAENQTPQVPELWEVKRKRLIILRSMRN